MNLMFNTTSRDGLDYVVPAPAGDRLYRLREKMAKLGRLLDRILFW